MATRKSAGSTSNNTATQVAEAPANQNVASIVAQMEELQRQLVAQKKVESPVYYADLLTKAIQGSTANIPVWAGTERPDAATLNTINRINSLSLNANEKETIAQLFRIATDNNAFQIVAATKTTKLQPYAAVVLTSRTGGVPSRLDYPLNSVLVHLANGNFICIHQKTNTKRAAVGKKETLANYLFRRATPEEIQGWFTSVVPQLPTELMDALVSRHFEAAIKIGQ